MKGQNVRLAARLCGWKIDIRSHSQFEEEGGAEAFLNRSSLDETEDAVTEEETDGNAAAADEEQQSFENAEEAEDDDIIIVSDEDK